MSTLPPVLLTIPLAHRGLHDRAAGRIENSPAAFAAAIAAGYGIECDVQLTADGQAVVFHDAKLDRLTEESGPVNARTAVELGNIALRGSTDTIPTLKAMLNLVAGRVPLLIEIKDQDGGMGPNVGRLEQAVSGDLADYRGPVAVMSYNPHSTAAMARLAPAIARGLTTESFTFANTPGLDTATRDFLRGIPDFDRVGASFISHEAIDLDRDRVRELKARGVPILCWTVRSASAETEARKVADNVTFEGYLADLP